MSSRDRSAAVMAKLKAADLRPTQQRLKLGELLWKEEGCHRHVTAEELYNEAMQAGVKVSVATVYNTLHQFTDAGLLREIIVEGGRSYFDTNTSAHYHFYNEDTAALMDIDAEHIAVGDLPSPPPGTAVNSVDVVIRVRNSQ